MQIYSIYIDLLMQGSDAILFVFLWAIIGVLATIACGLWLPMALSIKSEGIKCRSASRCWHYDWIYFLPVALAGGVATQLCCWMTSLFITGEVKSGNIALLVIVVLSIGWIFQQRKRMQHAFSHPVLFLLLSIFALTISLWHHAATEMPVADQIYFSDLHADLPIHVSMARLVADDGLPLKNLWGTQSFDYSELSHTGHATYIAGTADILGISLFQGTVVIWLIATLLITWCVLALLRNIGISSWAKFVVVVAALVWGGFNLPNLNWIQSPYLIMSGSSPNLWVAGSGYWNITQILSIALTFAGLLLLELRASIPRSDSTRLRLLLAAVCLICVGGWMKPSLAIFYGPALMVWLMLNRARLVEYFCVTAVLLAGAFIYAIPAIFFLLPSGSGWSLSLDSTQWQAVGEYLLRAAPGLIVIAVIPLIRLTKRQGREREWRTIDLALIAMMGSIIFALIFRENQFVGSDIYQPNIWWGLHACIVILVPFLLREAIALTKSSGWRRAVAIAGLIMATLQIYNGLTLAIAYPVLGLRNYQVGVIETMKLARSITNSQDHFVVDPILDYLDAHAYLSRPALLPTTFGPVDTKAARSQWVNYIQDGGNFPDKLVDRLDAIIIHVRRIHVIRSLRLRGWQEIPLNVDYALWRSPS